MLSFWYFWLTLLVIIRWFLRRWKDRSVLQYSFWEWLGAVVIDVVVVDVVDVVVVDVVDVVVVDVVDVVVVDVDVVDVVVVVVVIDVGVVVGVGVW